VPVGIGWPTLDLEVLAVAIFLVVVALIVARIVDEVVSALIGAILAVILIPGYTVDKALSYVDWNVIAILVGMWIIAGYLSEAGFVKIVIAAIRRRTRSYKTALIALALTSGFISMFLDNVLVILLLGGVALDLAVAAGADPVFAILLVGFSANFMGTALLLGDLPPQLLHSVAGAEFIDFIWFRGLPSSFPLLTITFLLVLLVIQFCF